MQTYTLKRVPIGIPATGMRRESDSMGEIEVPADHYWGAQTAAFPDPFASAATVCRCRCIALTVM